MKIELTPIQNRYVALLLLVIAVAVAVTIIAIPTRRLHQHYDQIIEEYSDHLARYERVATMRPRIEAATKSVMAHEGQKYYLKATSPTLAAAELQGLVTRIADEQKARVVSSQSIPGKEDSKAVGPNRITMSIQLNAGIIPLQMVLHTLESHEPYLFVDQLSVRANQGRTYKPIPGMQPEFVVQLTVSAYMKSAGAKP